MEVGAPKAPLLGSARLASASIMLEESPQGREMGAHVLERPGVPPGGVQEEAAQQVVQGRLAAHVERDYRLDLAGLVPGLSVPKVASRHEILATEPLRPFLDPMIVTLRHGVYFSQSMRGEVIGGLSPPHPMWTAGGTFVPRLPPGVLARVDRAHSPAREGPGAPSMGRVLR